LTEETRGMIGAREIGLMRPDAVLVNVGRGPIIDQPALASALREKRIAAAGLDVFETQPMPRGDPLASLDNVVLSPHAICDTYELRRDVLALVARELGAFAHGRLPANILNPEVVESEAFRAKLKRFA
jgi:phosphoglycerate dehydrogenase-like enzyme